jgi:hypothetical protein
MTIKGSEALIFVVFKRFGGALSRFHNQIAAIVSRQQ